jgi:pimeloyl-ACP methyl ester carboxylesterase
MARRPNWAWIFLVFLATSLGLWGTGSPGGASSQVLTEPVCFVVHVPGDPVSRHVFGTRYHAVPVTQERTAVLLVHGGTTRAIWDVRQDFSVARNLARAGYVVIAYDHLGFGDSPYGRPHGGRFLNLEGARTMLHEVVGQVEAGAYGIDGNCSGDDGGTAGTGSQKAVLVGHSAGGAIVSGYQGQYHDVVGVVQAAWSNHGLNPEFFAPGHPGWNLIREFATGNEYLYFLRDDQGRFNRSQCEAMMLYAPGMDADIRHSFCSEPTIKTVAAPAGFLPSLPSIVAQNRVLISRVGPGFPVLLAWAEFESIFRPEDRQAEDEYWREHCSCDVTVWTQHNAGHAFQAHRSMPAFTDEVVAWLRSQRL